MNCRWPRLTEGGQSGDPCKKERFPVSGLCALGEGQQCKSHVPHFDGRIDSIWWLVHVGTRLGRGGQDSGLLPGSGLAARAPAC